MSHAWKRLVQLIQQMTVVQSSSASRLMLLPNFAYSWTFRSPRVCRWSAQRRSSSAISACTELLATVNRSRVSAFDRCTNTSPIWLLRVCQGKRIHQITTFGFCYPRDAMLARSLRQRRVRTSVCLSGRLSVCPSVCHTPVLCLVERKQDREMYTIWQPHDSSFWRGMTHRKIPSLQLGTVTLAGWLASVCMSAL